MSKGLGNEYSVFKGRVELGSDWRDPRVTHLGNSSYSTVGIEIKKKDPRKGSS